MARQTINNAKLGAFVLGGLLFLILLLYMIGRNRSLFGSTYLLKARFENVQGLIPGNNVRYAGIQAGTVKKIDILNDTTIEVSMIIETKMENIIRKDAITSIGTDGLVGNKVINIVPGRSNAAIAIEGDLLATKKALDTDEILNTLSNTNKDVAIIVSGLKSTVERINNSSALWTLLSDETIPADIRNSATNIRLATSKASMMTNDLHAIIGDIKDGKGSAGILLKDTAFAYNLNEAAMKMRSVGVQADNLSTQLNSLVSGIQNDINTGKGPANSLLKDTSMVNKLNKSLDNIQMGTDGFNQNMEALKKSFLFRGYFRRQEKQKEAAKRLP
ncbi:phospholipid/cholesterol/gamma-HCH transport system substrate-binding protein [Daejeonella rubra]|uniref:Phospholipid/cholesterol/gamma-HCH transport system substrate-binding protein n=1 Tax=Daejeonella rubra TaxID=990371 RepID=A0A1G9S331_9SPHI|nr:MCE family protein [Daejeonella rubra]SDM29677.1 phospholipid/cholesterol/gamma-HCH transport system substrate-binding protein [Daejeonella rubra]